MKLSDSIELIQHTNYGKGFVVIDALSSKMNTLLTAGQSIVGLRARLSSFNNKVIDDLYRDLFWTIYQVEYHMLDAAPEGRESVRTLLEWVLSDPAYKANMLPFANTLVGSAAAAYVVTEQLLQLDQVSVAVRAVSTAEALDEEADKMDSQAEEQGIQPGDDEAEEQGSQPGDDEADNDAQQAAGQPGDEENDDGADSDDGADGQDDQDDNPNPQEQMRQQAEDLRQDAQDAIDDLVGNDLNTFQRSGSISTGADVGTGLMSFLSSWGTEKGGDEVLDPDKLRQVMTFLSTPGMGNLLELVGRVRGLALKTLEGRAPIEIVADEGGFTKRIPMMTPRSLYSITSACPYREQARQDWIVKGLEGIRQVAHADQEGDFIALVDTSISMGSRADRNYTRHEIANALAIGLSQAAHLNGQAYHLAKFSDHGSFDGFVTNSSPIDQLFNWLLHVFDGGTDFDYPLNLALDLLDGMDKDERTKNDILLITDGECYISEEVVERIEYARESYGLRLYILLIGSSPEEEVVNVADKVLDFTSIEAATATLSTMMWDREAEWTTND